MKSDERGLIHGRRQQRYDREGATSFQQENYGGGGEYRGELDFGGFSDQDFGSQGYSGQGYGDRSYGDPDFGGQAFARRGGEIDPDAGMLDLGATAYERQSDFGYDEYRGDPAVQHSGAVEYGDVGDAPGFAQTVGGHNYDGRGRLGGDDKEPVRAARPRTGDQRGIGPRGYRRSDARLLEDVCEQLMEGPVDVGDVEITVSNGEVTLSGTVEERWEKRAIEDIAAQVRGVHDVHNRVRVRPRHTRLDPHGARVDADPVVRDGRRLDRQSPGRQLRLCGARHLRPPAGLAGSVRGVGAAHRR